VADSGESWDRVVAGYAHARWRDALLQLANTVLPFAALWYATWRSLEYGYGWTLLLAIPTGGFLIRLFIILHDCGHGSFSPSRHFNLWLGRILGVVTFTPFAYWRRVHGIHHATSGNLDRRIAGDVPTLTLAEYRSAPTAKRLFYRLFRMPLVLLTVGAPYQFLIKYRFPLEGLPAPKWPYLRSALWTNAGIVAVLAALDPFVGWPTALLVHVTVLVPVSWLGVWLFYVQHNFEATSWSRNADWDVRRAALQGSSYYALPRWLQWITGNIGIHHVHHLCPRVPNYALQTVLDEHPALAEVSRLTLLESLRCARLALWDEDAGRLVSFRTARRAGAPGTTPAP
jgi:omega-6 fatty acid desaturase (delta-12 desaturase)